MLSIIQNNTLLISPGDLIDKHVILNLKLNNLPEGSIDKEFILEELSRLDILLEYIYLNIKHDKLALQGLIISLSAVNTEQWGWEDKVRGALLFQDVAISAVNARTCNTKRVNIKNEINKLFNYPVETKNYKERGNNLDLVIHSSPLTEEEKEFLAELGEE